MKGLKIETTNEIIDLTLLNLIFKRSSFFSTKNSQIKI